MVFLSVMNEDSYKDFSFWFFELAGLLAVENGSSKDRPSPPINRSLYSVACSGWLVVDLCVHWVLFLLFRGL